MSPNGKAIPCGTVEGRLVAIRKHRLSQHAASRIKQRHFLNLQIRRTFATQMGIPHYGFERPFKVN